MLSFTSNNLRTYPLIYNGQLSEFARCRGMAVLWIQFAKIVKFVMIVNFV